MRIAISSDKPAAVVRSFRPDKQFWESWRADREGMRRRGYYPRQTEDGEWVVNQYIPLKEDQDALAQIAASRAIDSDIVVPTPSGMSLLPYQRAGVAYAMTRDVVLIADEMGLGKTIQAVALANMIEPSEGRILVVCPAGLRLNWQREFERWDTRARRVRIANGAVPGRDEADVVIVNYDRLAKLSQSLYSERWALVVYDEAHYLKSPDAARTRAAYGEDGRSGIAAKKYVLLTGTPIMNRPIELWTHLKRFCSDHLGADWMAYAARYCAAQRRKVARGKFVWDVTGASNTEELGAVLRATIMVRRTKADVLDQLPSKRRRLLALAPDTAQAKRLVARERQIVEEAGGYQAVAEALTDGRIGGRHVSELAAIRHALALEKMALVVEHVVDGLESAPKCVVFTWHKDVAEQIAAAISAALGEHVPCITGETEMRARQAFVDEFQSKDAPRVLVATIATMGTGHTLTRADWCVFTELSWTPADLMQAEDRLHRIGQRSTVVVDWMVYDDSLESYIARRVADKQEIIESITS